MFAGVYFFTWSDMSTSGGKNAHTYIRMDGAKISGDAHINPNSQGHQWMLGGNVAVNATEGQKVDVYSSGYLHGGSYCMFTGFML